MIQSKIGPILILLLSITISACSSADNTVVNEVSAKEAAGMVANGFATIIDVRTDGEWNNKHIPGAKHFVLSDLKNHLDELKSYKNKKLIMQCATGGRSSKAVEILQQLGFDNVVNMTGGIVAWQKANLPIE